MAYTTTDELVTRIMMRLQEAHRERAGETDLDAGYRIGLLHAMNTVQQVKIDADGSDRMHND